MSFLKSATIFGRSIHALVDDSVSQADLEKELRRQGVDVEEVRPLMPSLEDVFVELTYQRQREMEAAHA
jgi:hypothetical protein